MQFLLTLVCFNGLFAASTLSGIILNEQNKPVSDVFVELYPTLQKTQSDQNGLFYFPLMAAGRYEIHCAHVAYQASITELEIKSSIGIKVSIFLKPATNVMKELYFSADYQEVAGNVITRREIEAKSAAGTEGLIEDIGGLQVYRTDGSGTKISIRGSSSKHVKVLLDGVPFNSSMDGSFDLSAIPTEIIERVEVYKQGSAELTGQGIGGLINIVTRKDGLSLNNELNAKWIGTGFYSDRDELYSNRFFNSEISTANTFLLFKHNIMLTGSYKDLANRWSYINAAKLDAYRYIDRPNTPFEMQNGYIRGNNFSGSISSVFHKFSYSYFFNYNENKNGLPGYIDKLNKSAFMSDISRKHRIDLQYKFRENDYFTFNSFMDNGSKHIEIYDQPPYIVNTNDEYLNRGMNLKYLINLPWVIIRQGAAYNYEELKALSLKGKINSRENSSFYTVLERNDSLKFGWSSTINTQAGVRHEILSKNSGQDFYNAQISWEHKFYGFTLRPQAAYNETYNLPSFSDLFWMDNTFSVGNPNLKPEFAFARSAGVFADWSNQAVSVSASAEYFSRSVKNLIVWTQDFLGKYSPKNNQGAYFSGWDYQAKVAILDKFLTLQADYHQLFSKNFTNINGTDGKFVIYKPKNSFSTALTVDWHNFNSQIRADYNGKLYQNEANTQEVDPYWLFGLNFSYIYKLNRQTEIKSFIETENILDKQYQIVYGYPVPGRSVKLGFKINYEY